MRKQVREELYHFFQKRMEARKKETERPGFHAGLAGRECVANPEEGSGGMTQEKAFACHTMTPVTGDTVPRSFLCPRRGGKAQQVCHWAAAAQARGTWRGHMPPTLPSACGPAEAGNRKRSHLKVLVCTPYLFSCTFSCKKSRLTIVKQCGPLGDAGRSWVLWTQGSSGLQHQASSGLTPQHHPARGERTLLRKA